LRGCSWRVKCPTRGEVIVISYLLLMSRGPITAAYAIATPHKVLLQLIASLTYMRVLRKSHSVNVRACTTGATKATGSTATEATGYLLTALPCVERSKTCPCCSPTEGAHESADEKKSGLHARGVLAKVQVSGGPTACVLLIINTRRRPDGMC
jgi:hypothetical protein